MFTETVRSRIQEHKSPLRVHTGARSNSFSFCQLEWKQLTHPGWRPSWQGPELWTEADLGSQSLTGQGAAQEKPPTPPGHRRISQDAGSAESQGCPPDTLRFRRTCLPTRATSGDIRPQVFSTPKGMASSSERCPETSGLRPVLLSVAGPRWPCDQRKRTPGPFHPGFTRGTSGSNLSGTWVMIPSPCHRENNAGAEVSCQIAPHGCCRLVPSCSRNNLNQPQNHAE